MLLEMCGERRDPVQTGGNDENEDIIFGRNKPAVIVFLSLLSC